MPRLNRESRAVVAVATGDTAGKIRQFRRETGAKYPILLDPGPVSRSFGIQSSPTFVLIRRGGAIAYKGKHVPE